MHVWLSNQIGTSAANITLSLVLFIVIITIIAVIIMFLRRLTTRGYNTHRKKRPPRLTLCDTLAIDRTRRLILIRRDDAEHLILIGGLTDVVIESNIINKRITHKSTDKQKQDTQSTLTTTETNSNPNLTEKIPFSVSEREHSPDNISKPFMNQYLEDSAITAEIEGRQEPSLFIPVQKK
ncbi:flagellar biosynthetic protein FliO [Bartonella gliris]|uniref:flagellar biosynthetic protein FliO n=1 Tax=Bartonella gliris TaxID=3004109 RepID=UPI00295E3BFD|nr:flagellar biosynthetic protein FliO [Bartonella gliris]